LNNDPREPNGLRGQFLLPSEVSRIKNILFYNKFFSDDFISETSFYFLPIDTIYFSLCIYKKQCIINVQGKIFLRHIQIKNNL